MLRQKAGPKVSEAKLLGNRHPNIYVAKTYAWKGRHPHVRAVVTCSVFDQEIKLQEQLS